MAEIARLDLSDEELKRYELQLKMILEAFSELDEVDTEEVEPSFHPIELEDIFREDRPCKWAWDPLENSEHKEDRYFRGPRIQ